MDLINAYKVQSKSAKALAKQMGVVLNNEYLTLMKGAEGINVINWGDGDFNVPNMNKCKVFNKPEAIRIAVNKMKTFDKLDAADVPTPDWTTNKDVVQSWLQHHFTVVARTRLEGRDGEGIVLVKPGDSIPDAKIYTKFIPNCTEYRVNVAFDKTMGVQKKVPVPGATHNHMIKTTGGGYGLHLLSESEIPHGLRPVAKAAVKALGLDFGGVDMIRTTNGQVYVLEVNTAPELTPSMVVAYAKEFNKACSSV